MAQHVQSLKAEQGVATPPHRLRLFERYRRVRNDLVARPAFQRWASGFLLTRWVARRQANALFQLTTGFTHSQILYAGVRLGIFDNLKDGPRSASDIGQHAGMSSDATLRLLRSMAALRLVLQDRRERWWLDDLGAVVAGNRGIQAMIRHHPMLYRDLADPVRLLRDPSLETETERFWRYGGKTAESAEAAEQATAYSELMEASNDLIAAEIVRSYDFGRHRIVLDVGGGNGAFLSAVGQNFARPQLWLFDLPDVAELARQRFERSGLSPRAQCFGGDFFHNDIPTGADCITLVRVLCDHDDAAAQTLLRNIRQAMRPGDRMLIAEPMAGINTDGSVLAAYFGMYFLAMRSGRCRTPQQICELLHSAGFRAPRRRRTAMPLFADLIVAHV